MSLINQMLKDLEKRSKPLAVPNYIISGNDNKSPLMKYKGWIAGIVASIFILFTLLTWINHSASQTSLFEENTLADAKTLPALPVPASESPPQNLATLTGITLEVQKDITDLNLMLSDNRLYRVVSNAKERVVIVLEQARLIANIPPLINRLESAIQDIQMLNQKDGNLRMTFLLKPGAELSQLNMITTGKQPELQISFHYAKPVNETASSLSGENVFVQQKSNLVKTLRYDISLEEEYQSAMQIAAGGAINQAIILLTKIVYKDSEFAQARESLISLLLQENRLREAQAFLQTGLEQRPHYPAYIKLKARILVDQDKMGEALKLLLVEPPGVSDDPEYHAYIAALYQKTGKALYAKELYEKLLMIEPSHSSWWMGLGITLESMGQPNQAIDAYRMASSNGDLLPEIKEYIETRLSALQ